MASTKASRSSQSSAMRGLTFGPPNMGMLLSYLGRRWKIWSERDASVAISHNDPAESYTAACFGAPHEDSAEGFLAMGCASGRVQMWGPRSGEQLGPAAAAFSAIAQGADCAVSSLAPPNSKVRGATVFVACKGLPQILEVGVLDGTTRASFRADKVGICHLAVGGQGSAYLLAAGAGAALKLWALCDIGAGQEQPRARRRLASPGNVPSCLDVSDVTGVNVLALCCDGALQVDVFSCDGVSSKSMLEADLILSAQDRIWTAKFFNHAKTADAVVVAGAGPSAASLWSFNPAATRRSKAVPPIIIVSADEVGGHLLCSRSASNVASSSPLLLVAYGSGAHPAFAEAGAGATKGAAAIITKKVGSKASTGHAQQKAGTPTSTPEPTVLGPLEAGAARKRQLTRRAAETDEAGESQHSQKRVKLQEPERVDSQSGGALSLAPLVRQGLRSRDSAAMDQLFHQRERKTLDRTIADLSGVEAFDLLQECTTRLLSGKGSGVNLSSWIKRVFVHHCAFIGSQPRLKAALGPLKEALEARLSSRRSLERLRGRIRMMRELGQELLKAKSAGEAWVPEEQRDAKAPLVEYVEGHSDCDEEEDDDEEEEEGEEDEEEGDDCDIWADESDEE